MKIRIRMNAVVRSLLVVAFALAFAANASAGERFTFVSFDYPGAVSTAIMGINNRGDLVGAYEYPAQFFHGFVYRNGQFTSIDGPGAAFTQLRGINEQGDIVGTFISFQSFIQQTPGGGFQGLIQKNGGALTVYMFPGHINTILHNIAASGLIYGCYHDEGFDNTPQETMHGIIVRPDGSLSSEPDGSTMNVGGNPEATRYAGQLYDFTEHRHRGYITQNGTRVSFDVPGSNLTMGWGMNASGEAVGVWGDSSGHPDPEATSVGDYHGFLRTRQGAFLDIRYPNSLDTKAFSINQRGEIVGSYVDANGVGHGFIASRAHGNAHDVAYSTPQRMPRLVKTAFGAKQGGPGEIRVALMPVIPANKKLQPPAEMGSCHHVTLR